MFKLIYVISFVSFFFKLLYTYQCLRCTFYSERSRNDELCWSHRRCHCNRGSGWPHPSGVLRQSPRLVQAALRLCTLPTSWQTKKKKKNLNHDLDNAIYLCQQTTYIKRPDLKLPYKKLSKVLKIENKQTQNGHTLTITTERLWLNFEINFLKTDTFIRFIARRARWWPGPNWYRIGLSCVFDIPRRLISAIISAITFYMMWKTSFCDLFIIMASGVRLKRR